MSENYVVYHEYLQAKDALLYTIAMLPNDKGSFPIVLLRVPYVDAYEREKEETVDALVLAQYEKWLDHGYAVVFQHCRGRGKSTGDFIPYVNEREDGLMLLEWVRKQKFYAGEIYLTGRSYYTSVHYCIAPFAEDVKGAVFEVQDNERYNGCYRNGFYKIGLNGGWYMRNVHKKSCVMRNYVPEAFHLLPLSDFTRTVLGKAEENMDEVLMSPWKSDFHKTRISTASPKDVVKNATIPILLVTGFYDIYTGGIFDTWNSLSDERKSECALLVSPYDHSLKSDNQPIVFEKGNLLEQFGEYQIKWFDYIRQKGEPPVEPGKVTYYKLFGNEWCCDDFDAPAKTIRMMLGEGIKSYVYNPYAPATFKGGLCTNFGGAAFQDPPNSRYDILSFYSEEFNEDILVKGKMRARLCVKSDCEDTCFYMRISLAKKEGDYGLRDDIHSVAGVDAHYIPGSELMMDFTFDEHAFVIHKGERLRFDVSSSAFPLYVRHTNQKGHYALQREAKIATNTVLCEKSYVEIAFA